MKPPPVQSVGTVTLTTGLRAGSTGRAVPKPRSPPRQPSRGTAFAPEHAPLLGKRCQQRGDARAPSECGTPDLTRRVLLAAQTPQCGGERLLWPDSPCRLSQDTRSVSVGLAREDQHCGAAGTRRVHLCAASANGPHSHTAQPPRCCISAGEVRDGWSINRNLYQNVNKTRRSLIPTITISCTQASHFRKTPCKHRGRQDRSQVTATTKESDYPSLDQSQISKLCRTTPWRKEKKKQNHNQQQTKTNEINKQNIPT